MANVLDSILGALFGKKRPAEPPSAPAPTPAPAPAPARPAQPAPAPVQAVDIEAHLDALAARAGEKLNWRTSIVDLMKLLGIDSSLQNRKELANELGYTGDMGDSAAMNIWLHRQVMTRVAANGGKVPANLID